MNTVIFQLKETLLINKELSKENKTLKNKGNII